MTVWCGGCGKTRTWSSSDLAAQFGPEVTDHQIAGRNCACGDGWGWVDYRQNHSAEVAKGGIGREHAATNGSPLFMTVPLPLTPNGNGASRSAPETFGIWLQHDLACAANTT